MLIQNKKISMKYVLLYIVLSMTIIGGIAIGLNQYINRRLNFKLNDIINLNIELTDLKTYLNKNNFQVSNYFNRNDNDDYFVKYYDNRDSITSITEYIYDNIKEDENSCMYFRIMENLLIYEKELADSLFRIRSVDIQTYGRQQELKKLYTFLDQIINNLTDACIKYQVSKYENINLLYKKVERNVYIFLLVIVLLNFWYIVTLIKDIVSNLNDFSKSAAQLALGNWYIADIEPQNSIELDLFATAFNKMKDNILAYMSELESKSHLEMELMEQKLKNAQMTQLVKESQLSNLQSQMNPHFLFNTLNIISRTAMFDGNEAIVKLMQSMSKILRYNVVNIHNLVSLREELEIVQAYLYIQETRFQDQMSFEIKVDNINLDEINMPPMVLQPIVENSIKHGFKNKEEGGIISIKIVENEGSVLINIVDNGEGITPNKLKKVFIESDKECKEKCNVGLRNVKKRLELSFGQKDILKIESAYGYGTTVTITLPKGGKVSD